MLSRSITRVGDRRSVALWWLVSYPASGLAYIDEPTPLNVSFPSKNILNLYAPETRAPGRPSNIPLSLSPSKSTTIPSRRKHSTRPLFVSDSQVLVVDAQILVSHAQTKTSVILSGAPFAPRRISTITFSSIRTIPTAKHSKKFSSHSSLRISVYSASLRYSFLFLAPSPHCPLTPPAA